MATDVQPRKGDSGSPLLTIEGSTLLVHGVLSEGPDFDDYTFGVIYTQVPDRLRPWIASVVRGVDESTAEACSGVTWQYQRGPTIPAPL